MQIAIVPIGEVARDNFNLSAQHYLQKRRETQSLAEDDSFRPLLESECNKLGFTLKEVGR